MTLYTLPHGVENSGEGIYGRHSHNAKIFEWIEHSGIRKGINCKQNEGYYLMPYNSRADVVSSLAERYDIKSNVKLGGFDPSIKRSTSLATLIICDTTK